MTYKVDWKGATPGWVDRVLVLWEEDDARPPDREGPNQALRRMSGLWGPVDAAREEPTARVDVDDQTFALYRGGWVKGYSCGLGFVGVVVEEVET